MFKSVQKPIFNINSSKLPLYYIDARCQEIEVYLGRVYINEAQLIDLRRDLIM